MSVIELSTGHVFAAGSVRVVGPVYAGIHDEDAESFQIIGDGYTLQISRTSKGSCAALRQEAIEKLLG